jgi:RHS repeat-associated protein
MSGMHSTVSALGGRHLGWSLTCAGWGFVAALTAGANPAAAERVTYIHPDALGSPMAGTDTAGQLLWQEYYRPYGDRERLQGDRNNSIWFTGKAQDPDTLLIYMGGRHYNPLIGRFVSIDPAPVGANGPEGVNRYFYANNNPYKFIDPNGAWSTDAHNYFINEAFADLPENIRGYIQAGSRAADALQNQLSGDHIHSMWPEGGSAEEMATLRSAYIRGKMNEFAENLKTANEHKAKGNTWRAEWFEEKAWNAFGEAQHPIMDSTSPVHNQIWRLSDRHQHGDYENSQETMVVAPQYREETVRRMRNMQEFLRE